MRWRSVAAQKLPLADSLSACLAPLSEPLRAEGPPDIAFLFLSYHYSQMVQETIEQIHKTVGPRVLVGCSAGGIIGGGQEIEDSPGLSLTCGWLPEVNIHPFHVADAKIPDLDSPPKIWQDLVGVPQEQRPQFVILADPFSIRVDHFLSGLDYAFPSSEKVGGLASGGQRAGENALILDRRAHWHGLVGVALSGKIRLETLVAQGCRPIGRPMTITQCERNLLLELDHRAPWSHLEELYAALPPKDRALMNHSLFLGIVMDPLKSTLTRGDFLIRNIMGVDAEKGILAVGAHLRPGQTVQFHLRDAETSAEDLQQMLSQHKTASDLVPPSGALLFSCLGRGAHLYGRPNHDTELFQKEMGRVPVGGFFCNGEIGPVGGATHLHGYTSCFGIFRDAPSS
jgi:small ligand-binding sensory domain FIST